MNSKDRQIRTLTDRVAELGREVSNLDRALQDSVNLGSGLRDRVSELESKLTKGKCLVHACAATERVSARLVAWAGEPDKSEKDDNPNE